MEIFLPDSNIDDSFFLFFFFLINLFTHRYTLQAAFFSKNRKCSFVRFIRILNSRKNILRIFSWFFLLKEIIRGIIREIFKDIFDMTISFLYACWSSIFFTINLFIHPLSLSLSLWKTGNGESISQRHTYDLDRRTNTPFRKEGWRSERNLNAPLTSRTRMRENVQRQPLLLWLCSYFFDSLFWTHVTQGHGVEHHQTRSQCVTASFSFFFFSKLRHIT